MPDDADTTDQPADPSEPGELPPLVEDDPPEGGGEGPAPDETPLLPDPSAPRI